MKIRLVYHRHKRRRLILPGLMVDGIDLIPWFHLEEDRGMLVGRPEKRVMYMQLNSIRSVFYDNSINVPEVNREGIRE
jgi:hypothetical protein